MKKYFYIFFAELITDLGRKSLGNSRPPFCGVPFPAKKGKRKQINLHFLLSPAFIVSFLFVQLDKMGQRSNSRSCSGLTHKRKHFLHFPRNHEGGFFYIFLAHGVFLYGKSKARKRISFRHRSTVTQEVGGGGKSRREEEATSL